MPAYPVCPGKEAAKWMLYYLIYLFVFLVAVSWAFSDSATEGQQKRESELGYLAVCCSAVVWYFTHAIGSTAVA